MQVAHVALKLNSAARTEVAEQLASAGLSASFVDDKAQLVAQLPEIKLLLLGRPPRLDWSPATQLRLLHVAGAGVDPLFPAEGLRKEAAISSCKGAHADAARDHVIALMLALARDLPRAALQQRAHQWNGFASQPLTGRIVCIVGLGEIGRRVAALCTALGMRVHGVNRSGRPCEHASASYAIEALSEAVAAADYVVLCLPLTSQTQQLFDARVLGLLPPHCVLINVSRGAIVDERELERRLRAGCLRGAALDVCEQEPLQADSSLWDCPNLLLTPHCAGHTPDYLVPVVHSFIDAIEHVRRGERPPTWVSRELEY